MRKKRMIVAVVLALALAAGMLSACAGSGGGSGTSSAPQNDHFQVGIIQLVEHPALDAAREGFIAALSDEGIRAEFDYQNAQRDIPTLSTISQRFVNNNVDLVLAIATASVQAIAAETDTIPVVGSAITSYERAGVVNSNEAPGFNVTGASDMNPIEAQINLIKEFLPDIQTLGIIYSTNEPNSVYQADIARGVAESLGLTVVEGTVTTTGDVQQNMLSVARRVDAIFIPTDNTHADAIAVVTQVSLDTGVPVFPGEENMVTGGGLATVGVSYFDLGYQSGLMAVTILRDGGNPATMPIQFAQHYTYTVNGHTAEQLGIAVPARLHDYIEFP